jgi:transposase InsO family protein
VPYDIRVRIVQAVMRGTRQADVAVAFGVSVAVIQKFMTLFDSGGMEALRLRPTGAAVVGGKRKRKVAQKVPRDEVVAAREANPEWGSRRIRDVLARFAGLGVSETTVRRILHDEGLLVEQEKVEPRDKPARRFERAEPNQLWQSDLFTFELRRHQRVYLVGFMDDYSRYLVSWAMAHHQKSSLVIEALERGIAEYGHPREVLTDQGRQYAAWRGKTEFQELLRRYGIEHSKSRPQHPETLGKIERFWKTLWQEFLSKTCSQTSPIACGESRCSSSTTTFSVRTKASRVWCPRIDSSGQRSTCALPSKHRSNPMRSGSRKRSRRKSHSTWSADSVIRTSASRPPVASCGSRSAMQPRRSG